MPDLIPDGRKFGGCYFYYNGWEAPNNEDGETKYARKMASSEDPFPKGRCGFLDVDVLLSLGTSEVTMKTKDALHFYQLIFPLCNPNASGITSDPRLPFYSEIEKISNVYTYDIGLGGSYGHSFKTVSIEELFRWDGIVYRDGMRGGEQVEHFIIVGIMTHVTLMT